MEILYNWNRVTTPLETPIYEWTMQFDGQTVHSSDYDMTYSSPEDCQSAGIEMGASADSCVALTSSTTLTNPEVCGVFSGGTVCIEAGTGRTNEISCDSRLCS